MTKVNHAASQQTTPQIPEYILPMTLLYKVLGIKDLSTRQNMTGVSAHGLHGAISFILQNVRADDFWYKKAYVDVAAAIMAGDIEASQGHFVHAGYLAGLPSEPSVDGDWYLPHYLDIVGANRTGIVVSTRQYFLEHGRQVRSSRHSRA